MIKAALTHAEHAKAAGVATPCTAHHVNYGGGCLNCGYHPKGAEKMSSGRPTWIVQVAVQIGTGPKLVRIRKVRAANSNRAFDRACDLLSVENRISAKNQALILTCIQVDRVSRFKLFHKE